jgi:DNA-binding transcriptional LysR family regulator
MDRLEAMAILVAAAETGSLSAAGRKLHAPLPTVSRKVAELEAHLGTRLLIRSPRRLTLTDAGAAYVAACRGILEQVDEAERAAAGEYSTPRGALTVTAPITFGRLHVLPVIADFLTAFPRIDIRLVLADRNVSLLDDDADMAVRIGSLPDSSMVATGVGSVRRVVCASPAYLAAHGTPQAPDDLARLGCVSFDAITAADVWLFPAPGTKAGAQTPVPVRSRLTVNTAEAAVDAAVAGVGVTRVLSYQAAAAIRAGALRIVLAAFEPPPAPVNLLHAAQGRLPLKMRGFLDFAAPRLRQALLAAAPGPAR